VPRTTLRTIIKGTASQATPNQLLQESHTITHRNSKSQHGIFFSLQLLRETSLKPRAQNSVTSSVTITGLPREIGKSNPSIIAGELAECSANQLVTIAIAAAGLNKGQRNNS